MEARSRERERKRGPGHIYDSIISVENLLVAWREFLVGKRKRKDVAVFSVRLMDNILSLHRDLTAKTYCHGSYQAFQINDPKPRSIHKASVRDRLFHHAIYRVLYPYLDRKFIHDSYSCRIGKGMHRAIKRFRTYALRVSHNHTRTAWVLKCDIRKFFASINHDVLFEVLEKHIQDKDVLWLLSEIIGSFHTFGRLGIGLPLGNLTSQLLVNIYMNEFDHFVKRELKVAYYIRYADDFVILHESKPYLEEMLPKISSFLEVHLKLSLHPNKVSLATWSSGIDFLGWVHFLHYRVLRTSTKRRLMRRWSEKNSASYLGLLQHGNTYTVREKLTRNITGGKVQELVIDVRH